MVTVRGFTLVEAVVAMAVLAIVIAVAAPSLSGLLASQQIRNAGSDLSAALVLARSEALTRNVPVTVAPVSGNWATGWTISDDAGTVLRRHDSTHVRIAVSGPARVIFNGDGRPDSTATPFSLSASDLADDKARCVRVRLNGRPSIAKGACA